MTEERRGAYRLSTEHARVDVDAVHAFLASTYWAAGIPRETVARAVEHSLVVGVRHEAQGQVAFARAVTDRATFCYLADVYVLPAHRGRGLSTWMMEAMAARPELQGLRRWMLATRDAHGLYARFGFAPLAAPERFMERHFAQVYTSP